MQYQLVVKVPFPGIGNDLKLEVPVHVTSGIDKPVPREPSPADSDGADRPPPALDLPPSVLSPLSLSASADDLTGSMYLPGPITKTRAAEGLYRCYRGAYASD